MAINTGIGPPDAGDPPITPQQQIVSEIGGVAINILWAPVFLAERWIKLPHGPSQDYLWITLAGLIYAPVFLSLYKSFRQK
jgi:hypothetical protein